jgi:hypothetical protein
MDVTSTKAYGENWSSNIEVFELSSDHEDAPMEEFSPVPVTEIDHQLLADENSYIKSLLDATGLEIKREADARLAYEKRKESGLFFLFLNNSFFSAILTWSNKELSKKGKGSINLVMLHAYLGLEIAMSLLQMSDIYDYWSTCMFLGSIDFHHVMSRNTFTTIRANLKFYPDDWYNHNRAVQDPLWHSRLMLQHFMKNAASVAVPKGCSALDENTVRCKARTTAKTYMKSKPTKFGIRFYSVVGWIYAYMHSLWDCGTGNHTNEPAPHRFCQIFQDMRRLYESFVDGTLVEKTSPSALWSLLMSHQVKRSQDQEKRVMFMDNFYTRHNLACQLKRLTDNKVFVIGTVRFNNVDGINRSHLKAAQERLKKKEVARGSWLLLQVLEKNGWKR